MRNAMCVALAAILLSTACSRPEPSKTGTARQETTTKYGVPVKGGPMDAILLKDYTPASSLVVPATEVKKARFPVIDVHSHSSMNGIRTRADVDAWVRTMDEVGIEMSVVFTGASGGGVRPSGRAVSGVLPEALPGLVLLRRVATGRSGFHGEGSG